MRRMPFAAALGCAVIAAGTLAVPVVAEDAATVTIRWEMNELAGTSVMKDSGPLKLDGTVNPLGVTSGYSSQGATGYHWVRKDPNSLPLAPERIIEIPDHPSLDAGGGIFTIEIRYRTKERFGNIIQKGQAQSAGGQWKVQAPGGIPSCLFKGPAGRAATGALTPINDNQWHVLTCVKTPSSVALYVDGEFRSRKNRETGVIDNSQQVTIGGKIICNQENVTCDYFSGDIDYVSISKGLSGPFVEAKISPSKVVVGNDFTVTGSVTDGATGAPKAGVPIHLFGQVKGTVGFVDKGVRATTKANGSFAFSRGPSATSDWYVSTGPAGSGVDSDTTRVAVGGKAWIHLDDKSVRAGTTVTFYGKVRPKSATVVKLQRKQSGQWITKRSETPKAGKYSMGWKAKSKVDFKWRVRVNGPTFTADHSRTLVLKVR